ncbi:hypothetical protein BGZ98_009646 [Dissophora globulifera]|nr:hypothetical protein BGZ98_009646 [Dissophora globulifera]
MLAKSQPSLIVDPAWTTQAGDYSHRSSTRESAHVQQHIQQSPRELSPKPSSKVGSAPITDAKTRTLMTPEQTILPAVGAYSRPHNVQPNSISGVIERRDSSATPFSRHQNNITFDHNKPLPIINADLPPPPPPPSSQPPPSESQLRPQGHQRRRSFIPTALMTSNLAKFVGRNHGTTSPTATHEQTTSPRSPRSPVLSTPKPTDQKDDEPVLSDGALLTADQFKWSIISCCNEIKGRVAKQRFESKKSPPADVVVSPPQPQPQKKVEKSKSGRFNSYSAAQLTSEVVLKDPRSLLQSLLQVMTSSVEEATGQQDTTAAATFYHGQSSQPHNQSHSSLMGTTGSLGHSSGTGTTKSSQPIRQAPPHSSSYPSLVQSSTSSIHSPPSIRSISSVSTQQQQMLMLQQQQPQKQQSRLGGKQSQTKLTVALGTDAVLKPLSMDDMIRLTVYALSVAPEQWIPWHLYDFFVQGMKYRDLVELLPTQSQKIVKSILETVDALIDYAMMIATDQSLSTQAASSAAAPATGSSFATGGSNGGSALGSGLGLRQQLSQAHLRTKSDVFVGPTKSMTELLSSHIIMALSSASFPAEQSMSPFPALLPSTNADNGGEAAALRALAMRTRKRRVIVDSLAVLVFRSRQDVSAIFHGSNASAPDHDSMLRPHLGDLVADERSKSKRRYSSAVVPGATSGSAGTAAGSTSMTLRLQAAERERGAGLKAFENLVAAFEEEFHPHKRANAIKMSEMKTSFESGILINTVATEISQRPVSMPNAAALPPICPPVPPRQARSLPGPAASPAAELVTVRSLSLPPWRKQTQTGSQVHIGQGQQNNRSHHSIVENPVETHKPESRPSSKSSVSAPAVMASLTAEEEKSVAEVKQFFLAGYTEASSSSPSPSAIPLTSATRDGPRPNSAPARIRPMPEQSAAPAPSPSAPVSTRPVPASLPAPVAASAVSVPAAAPTILTPMRAVIGRSKTTVSATLSSSWTTWKNYLLVLEEEEYVIVDTSDSEDERPNSRGD